MRGDAADTARCGSWHFLRLAPGQASFSGVCPALQLVGRCLGHPRVDAGQRAPVSIPSPYCPWPMLIAQGVVHARPSPMPAVPVVQKLGHCCVQYACEDPPAASP